MAHLREISTLSVGQRPPHSKYLQILELERTRVSQFGLRQEIIGKANVFDCSKISIDPRQAIFCDRENPALQ